MPRIVAGVAGGVRLDVPTGTSTRPTSDRAREAMFSTIKSLVVTLDGARFLDLYAGAGAVGLEALSRGAAHCLLVESDRVAVAVIEANVARSRLTGAVVRADAVERVVRRPPDVPYDVVFADPPYATADADVSAVVSALHSHGWLTPDALVVVERATRDGEWEWPDGVAPIRSRRYGEATLWYGRAAGLAPRTRLTETPVAEIGPTGER